MTWSIRTSDGFWNPLDEMDLVKHREIHSYTKEVQPDSLYRLQIFDHYGDGACCGFGSGWFTITNSTPSSAFPSGTVLWAERGDALEKTLAVYVWVDTNGSTQIVEHMDGLGYALIGGSEASSSNATVPTEAVASTRAGDTGLLP